MTNYYRVRLGRGSAFVDECIAGGYIGADFDIEQDLSIHLPDNWREFNKQWIPIFLEVNPGKSRVTAGLSCGMLWTVAIGCNEGDVILSPMRNGMYHVGNVTGPYEYAPGEDLPHRRPIDWSGTLVAREDMSDELRRTTGTPGTVVNVTRFAQEIAALLGGPVTPELHAPGDATIEDVTAFALEKHLEDFLVANWAATELGRTHKIYEVDGEKVGQQYLTDTGPMDVLAISHDGTELLVVELKRGRASDVVVGQIQRYMGYVAQDIAEPGQRVRGIIIALDDDIRIRRALAVAQNIDFYRYEVKFNLRKA